MRGLKSTILLIVVLAGLGGYIYFVDSKRPGGTPGPAGTIVESKEKVFPGLEADKIEEVRVTAEKETTLVKKQDATWKIVEPATMDADQTESSGLTTSLTSLEYGRIVEENAADLATYTPSLSVNQRYGAEKSAFAIRGFNQDQTTAPTVGVYFADVVGVRSQGGTTSGNTVGAGAFTDLQNVQVLKGYCFEFGGTMVLNSVKPATPKPQR